jgi:hypothetical protein
MRLTDNRRAVPSVRVPARRPRQARPGSGRDPRLPVARQLIVLGVALAAIVAGSIALGAQLRSSRPPAPAQAGLHGLLATLSTAGWVPMEAHTMDQGGGFQMPAQMMPGAPVGDQMRLGIPLTLLNTDGGEQRFDLAAEFFLVGGASAQPVALHSDTFGELSRLAPGSAVNGVLYFDLVVPAPTDPPLKLRWVREADAVEIPVPMTGSAPAPHEHG